MRATVAFFLFFILYFFRVWVLLLFVLFLVVSNLRDRLKKNSQEQIQKHEVSKDHNQNEEWGWHE